MSLRAVDTGERPLAESFWGAEYRRHDEGRGRPL